MGDASDELANHLSVIITLGRDPDEPGCAYCVVEPVSAQYDPYCSLDCATAAAVDDERDR